MTYTAPSPKASPFLLHAEAILPMQNQQPGQSFTLAREGKDLWLMRELVESASVGKQAFVVIDWPDMQIMEILRLPDGINPKLFYKWRESQEGKTFEASATDSFNSIADIERMLEEYKESSIEEILKYDSKITGFMQKNSVVSYTYFSRRTLGLASFRKAKEGATNHLNRLLEKLLEDKKLELMAQDESESIYNTRGKLFKIIG